MASVFALALMIALAGSAEDSESAHAAARSGGGRDSIAAVLSTIAAVDLDGRRWTAEDLRGRVVVIDFWATWCAPCLAELPRLKALRSRHSRADFEILGVSLDATSRQSLVSWLNRNRIDWPQIHERAGYGGGLAQGFGVERLPRTLLIDQNGRLAAVDLRGERLAAAVDALVHAGGSAARSEGPNR